MKVSGFTIVRNAVTLDYPFIQSIQSVLPLCDEFIVSVGKSQDDTLDQIKVLATTNPKLKIIETVWDSQNRSGGSELSIKTNETLALARGDWAFYIQADEVLHERGFENIQKAIRAAELRPQIDALVFDYHHFYGDYRHTITGRSWYRRETRLLKTGRGIESFRDAQGFRRNGQPVRVISSGATVFHYGYVRNPNTLKQKAEHMSQWWQNSPGTDYRLKRHIGIRKFGGTHPAVMNDPIQQHPNNFDPNQHPRIWDKREVKDLITLAWESVVPYRIGEFRNYQLEK